MMSPLTPVQAAPKRRFDLAGPREICDYIPFPVQHVIRFCRVDLVLRGYIAAIQDLWPFGLALLARPDSRLRIRSRRNANQVHALLVILVIHLAEGVHLLAGLRILRGP